jgi:hypothetical protein
VKANPLSFMDVRGLDMCKKCAAAIQPVRKILETFNPQVYKKKCSILCSPLRRGRGMTSGNTIIINSEEYGTVSLGNYVNFTQTIAHELRHCGESWWDRLRSLPPVTDEPHFFNEYHTNLDLAAEADAWAVEELVKKALDERVCCNEKDI